MNYRGAKINVNGAVSTEELHSAWLQLQQLKLRGQTYFKGKGIRVVSGNFGDIITLSGRPAEQKEKKKFPGKEKDILAPPIMDVFTYDVGTAAAYSGINWICGVTGNESVGGNFIFILTNPLVATLLVSGRTIKDDMYIKGTYKSWASYAIESADYSFACVPTEQSQTVNTAYPIGQFFSPVLQKEQLIDISTPVTSSGVPISTSFMLSWNMNAAYNELVRPGGSGDYYTAARHTYPGYIYSPDPPWELASVVPYEGPFYDYYTQAYTYLNDTAALPINMCNEPPNSTVWNFNMIDYAEGRVSALPADEASQPQTIYGLRPDYPGKLIKITCYGQAVGYIYRFFMRQATRYYYCIPLPPDEWYDCYSNLHIPWEAVGYNVNGVKLYSSLSPAHRNAQIRTLPDLGVAGEYLTENYDSVTVLDNEILYVYIKGIPPVFVPYVTSTTPNTVCIRINSVVVATKVIGSNSVTMQQAMIYKVSDLYVFIISFLVGNEKVRFVFRKEYNGELTNLSEYYDLTFHFLRAGKVTILPKG